AIGALLNHFSAEKAWWISNVLQPAGDIFIRLIKMIVVPIVISSLIVGIAGFALSTSSPWVLVVSYVRPCSLITSRRARISE
ncbi:cation:dicarboxylase symporter family transporter, partial [Vibrio cholerae O1]|nr:cation:dicarboxylase symporter family transporter [Vibrio cholerae O1]